MDLLTYVLRRVVVWIVYRVLSGVLRGVSRLTAAGVSLFKK